MSVAGNTAFWLRRAQPLLGTLVEVGVSARTPECNGVRRSAFEAAFAAIRDVQASLSRFEADSDIGRFHALRPGGCLTMRQSTRHVLGAALLLRDASDGAFDISLGTAPHGWRCDGDQLQRLDAAAQLDLGGIGKGYAVDCAVHALIAHGCSAGWVNAGGDLRVFGAIDVPVRLRDEASGGVRAFATLRDGAFATSHFGSGSRSRIAAVATKPPACVHVSVAAPLCLWADALTKIVSISGDTSHPLLARFDAIVWLH